MSDRVKGVVLMRETPKSYQIDSLYTTRYLKIDATHKYENWYWIKSSLIWVLKSMAQPAGAVEYTDCLTAED